LFGSCFEYTASVFVLQWIFGKCVAWRGIAVKILREAAGIILSLIGFFLAYIVSWWGISLLGNVPILRTILFYPSDAGWALVVLPTFASVEAAAYISTTISKSKVCSAATLLMIAAVWVFALVGMFIGHNYKFSSLAQYCIGIVVSIFCICQTLK
jgi:hypothetical protein